MGDIPFKAGDIVGGKYRLEKLLGEGAMGTVWAARNERTDRAFAVKFMLSKYARDPTLVQRFLNEARVCGRLEHPSLVEIYDLGVAEELGGAPFLVMELLRGEGLDGMLARLTRLDPRRICPLLFEVSSALDLAHQAGIVHRDIKPANVFLHRARTGEIIPKILDFGVSKTIKNDAEDLALTRAGVVLGSPLYMSPEQARGQADIDARCDIWGLGVILYQALAGVVPFNENNYNAVLSAILTRKHRSLREIDPRIPESLSETVDLCLVKDRNRRMASAAQLAAHLEQVVVECAGKDGVASLRAARPEPPRGSPPDVAPRSRKAVPSESDATEVMSRDSLPVEQSPESLRREARQRRLRAAAPLFDESDQSQPSSSRSLVLRRQWLSDLAAAVDTAKTDDIRDLSESLTGETDRAIRLKRVERQLADVEDAAEGSVAETERAIRLAREELRRSVSERSQPKPAGPLAPLPPVREGEPQRRPLLLLLVLLGLGLLAAGLLLLR